MSGIYEICPSPVLHRAMHGAISLFCASASLALSVPPCPVFQGEAQK
jgi:hypothetical protein